MNMISQKVKKCTKCAPVPAFLMQLFLDLPLRKDGQLMGYIQFSVDQNQQSVDTCQLVPENVFLYYYYKQFTTSACIIEEKLLIDTIFSTQ